MDIERMARDLAKAVQSSDEYKHYVAAKEANDADEGLQAMIEEFNLVRIQLSSAMQKETQDADEMDKLDKKLKETYTQVMGNKNMMDFNIAKQELDNMMNTISGILMMSINGEDPETCDPHAHSCSGSCDSCGGCH